MEEQVVWSHSRLNLLTNNPAEYLLNYVEGIKPKQERTALSLGSAVHYGLETGLDDLTDYYNEKGSFDQFNNYTDEQLIAECIIKAFFKRKDKIFNEILFDEKSNKILEVLEDAKEISLTAEFKSKVKDINHKFLGIIDRLLLTEKGWILIDYKTSSRDVEWSHYKSQLFKYKALLDYNFPDINLYKVVIINLKKPGIRRKKNENNDSYRIRLADQYEIDELMINYHIYNGYEFDSSTLASYTDDLTKLMDISQTILDLNLFYVNYSNITGLYGESVYAPIFYNKVDNYLLYNIKDIIFDEEDVCVKEERECDPIDMMVLTHNNVLNKYSKFKETLLKKYGSLDLNNLNKLEIIKDLKSEYICSNDLLEKYFLNLSKNL